MSQGGKRVGAGRKKGFAALEAERQREFIAQKLVVEFGPIVDKAIDQAKEGDSKARDWLTDRAFGKAQQSLDVTSDGESLAHNDIKDLTDGELTALAYPSEGGASEAGTSA
jgi:hypothetical protein